MRIVRCLLADPAELILTCLTDTEVLPIVPPDVIRLALRANFDFCLPVLHLCVINASHTWVVLIVTFETGFGQALITLDEAYVEVFCPESHLALIVRTDSHQWVFI